MKGHVYRRLFEEWEDSIAGGIKAVLERTGDLELYHYGIKGFALGSWYDALPIVPLTVSATELLGVPFRTYVKNRAFAHARADVNDLYRHIACLDSSDALIPTLARLRAQYLDFGRIVEVQRRETGIEGKATGIPEFLVPWLMAAAEGYLTAVFRMTGAEIRLSTRPPKLTHFDGSLRMVEVPFSLLVRPTARRVTTSSHRLRQSAWPPRATSESDSRGREGLPPPLGVIVPFGRWNA